MHKWLIIILSAGCLMIPGKGLGQETFSVTGTILSNTGKPLSEVSISTEGPDYTPVVTDSSGMFTLSASSGDVWLIITPASGYHPRRVFLNYRSELSIILTALDIKSGFEFVESLLGQAPRRDIINSFEDLLPEKSMHQAIQSVDQFLTGSVAGMYSTVRSGMPGDGTTAFIRGIKSMNTNNQPLYVIDGIPLEAPGIFQSQLQGFESNPMNCIDPYDITNLTVLKDNMAGSLYGMRGSNGVVVIETLKPTEVRTTIDFALRTGLSTEPAQIPQLNSGQHRTLANEVLSSSSRAEETFLESYPGLFMNPSDEEYIRYGNQTNWQDTIFSNGTIFDTYLRVRGGDEIARYGLSMGYLDHQGIIQNTEYNRFNIRFVGTFNVFRWLRMYVSTNLTTSDASLRESALSPETSPLLTALHKTPMMSPYSFDEEGNQLQILDNVDELGVSNPLAVIENYEAKYKNTRFLTTFRFEGDITPSLKLNSLIGLNINKLNESIFMPNNGMELYYDGEAYNVAKSNKNGLRSFYSDNYLRYNREFSRIHGVSGKVGFRVHTNQYQGDWGVAKNSHKSDEYKQLADGVSFLREIGGDNQNWNRMAAYASFSYSLLNKYWVYSSFTTEFSSLTGDKATGVILIGDAPFGMFYSAGAAWRISSESFLRNISQIEDLKVRISYGLSGNDDIGVYSSRAYYSLLPYRETSGMVPSPLSDERQKFETTGQLNGGVDLTLWGNRLSVNADLYRQTTKDLLLYLSQSSYSGFDVIASNNGVVSNNGWEVSLYSRLIDRSMFKWDLQGNLSSFKNRVEEIRNGQIVTAFEGGAFISREGASLLEFYGYQFKGVYSTSEEADAAGLVNSGGIPFGAGDAIFSDLSGPDGSPDGTIDEYDRTIIGSPIPELFGGLTNTLMLGNWSLSASLQFVNGREVFNYLRYQNERMTDLSNQSSAVLNRWFYEGQVTNVPRPSWDDLLGNSAFSTRWIEDGSYIRLKNVTLSYRVPKRVLVFRNLEVFITGINLFTIHHYLGYDPEFSYSSNVMEQGIDYGLMPQTRKVLAGIKIGL